MMILMLSVAVLSANLYSEELRCFQQVVTSCAKLGKLYEQKKEYRKALTFYDAACILDNADSCTILSYVYSKGLWGLDRDLKTASAYSERAIKIIGEGVNEILCKMGSPSGCLYFGNYKKDMGDENKAKVYYRKAKELAERLCRNSDGEGCLTLGQIYLYGLGVTQNRDKAFELIKRSCDDLGFPAGCFILSGFFNEKEDRMRYLERACDWGHHNACFEIWRETGKDKYFDRACELAGANICELYRRERNFRKLAEQ